MYITADRNTLPQIPENWKYLHWFLLILHMLWVNYEVLLFWQKKTTFGVWEVSFFSFYNNFLFTPKDTPTQNKITFFIDF